MWAVIRPPIIAIMGFIKTPIKGMNDFLPSDMRLREHVIGMIKETYETYGFSLIETPVMEHMENLTGKQGGENEKLIFPVMKRGADLQRALEKNGELADSALRYDLTVPLARYYANNGTNLPSPFKSLQIGNVFRADKPQKGRFRQFTQCDIDILGDSTVLAEVELISATTSMLTKIFSEVGISRFTVHVNDRRILKGMAAEAGFPESSFDEVFIILDKMDKIGLDGVREELVRAGFGEQSVDRYVEMFSRKTDGIACGEFCQGISAIEASVVNSLDDILGCVKPMISSDVTLVFDPTLVRGMSYYTGTIFEITIDGYNFSIAGGGRYDEMIGKFSGQKVCACGFSIGFERIITILKDKLGDKAYARNKECVAILVENGVSREKMAESFARAAALRKEGRIVTVQPLNKNAKFQIQKLEEDGYTQFERVYR
jgi:histidyl-tRNA synthetase